MQYLKRVVILVMSISFLIVTARIMANSGASWEKEVPGELTGAAISSRGDLIALSFQVFNKASRELQGGIMVLNREGDIVLQRLEPIKTFSITITPDGQKIIFHRLDAKVFALNPAGQVLWNINDNGIPVLSPTGKKLMLLQTGLLEGPAKVSVLDVEAGRLIWSKTFPLSMEIDDAVILDDGSLLISSSNYGKGAALIAFDSQGEQKWIYHLGVRVNYPFYIAASGEKIVGAAAMDKGKIQIIILDTKGRLSSSHNFDGFLKARPILSSEKNRVLILTTTGLGCYSLEGREVWWKKIKAPENLAADENLNRIALVTDDGERKTLTVLNGEGTHLWERPVERKLVFLNFSREGEFLVGGSANKIWFYDFTK